MPVGAAPNKLANVNGSRFCNVGCSSSVGSSSLVGNRAPILNLIKMKCANLLVEECSAQYCDGDKKNSRDGSRHLWVFG
jgi:hypothetical protein